VTAVDESELTSVSPAQLVIVRKPALYERASIQLLSAAVLLALGGGAWRIRSAALRKRSTLLEQMVEEKAGDLTLANRELAEANEELARAKEALEEANRDLDQIASTDLLAFVVSDLLSRHLIGKDRLFFDFLRSLSPGPGPFDVRNLPVA
jgi:hypothetical protein